MPEPTMKIFEAETPADLETAFNSWVATTHPYITKLNTELGYWAYEGKGKFFLIATWLPSITPTVIKLSLNGFYTSSDSRWAQVNSLITPYGIQINSINDFSNCLFSLSDQIPEGSTLINIRVTWKPGVASPLVGKLNMSLVSDDGTGLIASTTHGRIEQIVTTNLHSMNLSGCSQVITRSSRRHYLEIYANSNSPTAHEPDVICGIDVSII